MDLVFLAAEDLAVGVNHQGLLGFDEEPAALVKAELGMVTRRTGRDQAGDEADGFPTGELSRMNQIEPAVIQWRPGAITKPPSRRPSITLIIRVRPAASGSPSSVVVKSRYPQ